MYTQKQMKKLNEIDTKIADAIKKLNAATINEAKEDGVDMAISSRSVVVSRDYTAEASKKFKKLAV